MLGIQNRLKRLLLNETRFSTYLLYAVGEIVLVVIGILLALQINNWNSARQDRREAVKLYKNIHRQLMEDRSELMKVKEFNSYYKTSFERAGYLIALKSDQKTDSLAMMIMELSQYSDFHRSGNIYETLVNSGSIKLLRNIEVTSGLQRLEMTYNNLNKLEDIHWEIILNELSPELKGVINYATLEIVKPEKLYSVEIQNFLVESIYLTNAKELIYNRALSEIDAVAEEIDRELNDK